MHTGDVGTATDAGIFPADDGRSGEQELYRRKEPDMNDETARDRSTQLEEDTEGSGHKVRSQPSDGADDTEGSGHKVR